MGIELVEWILRADIEFTFWTIEPFAAETQNLMPASQRFRELERSVLDQLRIEPAVGSEVDIFEKDAEH